MRCGSCEIGIGNWGAEKEAAYKLPKTRSNFPVSMSPSTMSSASSSSSHRLPAIVYSHSSKWLEKFSPPPSISLNSPFPWSQARSLAAFDRWAFLKLIFFVLLSCTQTHCQHPPWWKKKKKLLLLFLLLLLYYFLHKRPVGC